MPQPAHRTVIAFVRDRRIAAGHLSDVAAAAKRSIEGDETDAVLAFDAVTSEPVELDLRGSLDDVRRRYPAGSADGESTAGASKKSRRGRPRLGVVSKEITLLPRHWAWLSTQQGGASATLRRLVEQARRDGAEGERVRKAQDAAYRFMYATLGDQPGFEDAVRALYASDADRFTTESEGWPPDLREHSRRLASGALPELADFQDARR